MSERTLEGMEAMNFETTLMMFFGVKEYQTAGQHNAPKHRRAGLRKILRVVMKSVDKIETTTRHRQALMANAESVYEALRATEHPSWGFAYYLIALIGRLLGYYSNKGTRPFTPSFWQTEMQAFTSALADGPETEREFRNEKTDAAAVRQGVVQLLKERGLSDFKVALIMNTTEYEVKRLLMQSKAV
ncbi:MAG: hypothetical protein H0X01_03625 [Nitrospira sp.]|nr:hypothetical protein [Nitrospira sp.]